MKMYTTRHLGTAFIAALACLMLVLPVHPLVAQEQEEKNKEEELTRIRGIADEVLELLSEATGLPIKSEIKIDIVNKAQVREHMMEMLEKEYPDNSLERQYEAYSYLGLVPEDIDIRQILVELITEQAGAFYNPENDTFYAISDLPEMFQNPLVEKTIIAHELTHGLQDQTLDLFVMMKELSDKPDQMYALSSTIEGMATVVMTLGVMPQANLYTLPDLGAQTRMQMEMMGNMPQMAMFNKAPKYLQESLVSPYAEGASFVQNFMKENPDTKVVALLENLPQTAEQILHYEKYVSGDRASNVELEAVKESFINDGWDELYSGGLGEFDLRVLMQIGEKGDAAVPIAKGWDAFRFAALNKGEEKLLLGASVWDSEADAAEFATPFQSVLESVWGSSGVLVRTEGKTVSFIAASNAELLQSSLLAKLAQNTEYLD